MSGEETQYIIFTSGSTGKPKGIEISANNVCNFMQWVRTFPVVREGGQVFLDQPPYSFDLSEYELVGALSTGGRLHAVSHELTADTRSLFADLAKSDMSVWVSTPSFADLCLVDPSFSESMLPSVKLFLFCGEALRHATAAALRERFPHAIVANTYGPTESTVAVTYCEIGEAELASDAPLPSGAPRPGTEIRICDPETGEPCATGDSGEIVIVATRWQRAIIAIPRKLKRRFRNRRSVMERRCARIARAMRGMWMNREFCIAKVASTPSSSSTAFALSSKMSKKTFARSGA